MTAPPTVAEALRDAAAQFAAAQIDAPRLHATALLGHVLGVDRAGLLARLRERLTEPSESTFKALIQRRLGHEPLQYILRTAEFLDFRLEVGPGVFIPRPETEQLVATALHMWDDSNGWALDLCCGSGAIAIALARARPRAQVLAVDRSAVARSTTRRNALRCGVGDRVHVLGSDLLTALRPRSWNSLGVLACNPPYVAVGGVSQPEVRLYEPMRAIEAGPHGTEIYARLIPQAAYLLGAGRPLVLELGHDQSSSVPDILRGNGHWTAPEIADDFQGIPRVLAVRRR